LKDVGGRVRRGRTRTSPRGILEESGLTEQRQQSMGGSESLKLRRRSSPMGVLGRGSRNRGITKIDSQSEEARATVFKEADETRAKSVGGGLVNKNVGSRKKIKRTRGGQVVTRNGGRGKSELAVFGDRDLDVYAG